MANVGWAGFKPPLRGHWNQALTSNEQHRASPEGIGELQQVAQERMQDGLSSSHISGGHWNEALTSNEWHRAVRDTVPNPAPACWPMNSGSVDTVPEPSGCTPLSLSSCDHRQAALSAAGLQRGQHAGAGLGTGLHQRDAFRCWLCLVPMTP